MAEKISENVFNTTLFEDSRQQEAGSNAEMYAQDAFCLCQMGDPQKGWQTLETGRARLLRQGLVQVRLRRILAQQPEKFQRNVQNLIEQEKALQATLQLPTTALRFRSYPEVAEELAQTRDALQQLTRPLLEKAGIDDGTIAPKKVQQHPWLDATENGILSLVVTKHGTLALLVTEEHLNYIFIPKFIEPVLSELVLGKSEKKLMEGWLVGFLNEKNLETASTILQKIGKLLWQPLDKWLQQQNIKRLILVPQGSLFLLPLHACPLEDGQLAGERYQISYLPAAGVLAHFDGPKRETIPASALLVANPTGDLPYTPSEVMAVKDQFTKTQVLWEAAAHPQAILEQAPAYPILHYSGHGGYNWEKPEQSGLLLREKGADKINFQTGEGVHTLTVSDIHDQLELQQTRLVVLSACETGLSEQRDGLAEEYLSLPGMLLQAGAPAVVASLWSVSDLATTLLMQRFYQEWLSSENSIAAALQKTQHWLRTRTKAQICTALDKLDQLWVQPATQDDDPAMKKRAIGQYWILREAQENLKNGPEIPFAHPYWWAAFQAVGDVF